MDDKFIRCVVCGRLKPEKEIGITGMCRECWKEYLEEHDLLMRTIIWRETGELPPPRKYK